MFWEIFTLVTGVVYIILEIFQNKWMWAVGFLTSAAAMVVFWTQGLYASFGLNCYYFAMSAVGLSQWIKDERKVKASTLASEVSMQVSGAYSAGVPEVSMSVSEASTAGDSGEADSETDSAGNASRLHLSRLSVPVLAWSAVAAVAGTAAFYYILKFAGDSQPLLDVIVTVLSAIATWWLARSYKEQWLLWVVADAASMIMCLKQGLPWMTALYGAYCISAVYGYIHWKKHGVYV